MGRGLVQIFTGDGKGKTTAATGEAVRAVGAGKKVAIVYFDKGGAHYNERRPLVDLGVRVEATGRDRIDPRTGRFDFSITDEDRAEARRGLELAANMLRGSKYDLVMLDEIVSCVALDMLTSDEVIELIESRSSEVEVIATGRNANKELKDYADLVSEVKKIKHYLDQGITAREGFDF